MISYSAKNVTPLRLRVKEMEKAQRTTQRELAELQDTLQKLSTEIADLNIRMYLLYLYCIIVIHMSLY